MRVLVRQLKPQVLDRDRDICYLCDRHIDRSLVFPHALSATVDHVKPLAMGGQTTLGNLRAAHFGCNMDKGDDLPPWWVAA